MTLSFIALALFAAFSTASECGGTIYDPSKVPSPNLPFQLS
jgi:hypothetical protein